MFTISTAESCTGGNIAHIITSVAGSSEYFKGSVVSYATEVKINVLGVPAQTIGQYGVVSSEVAQAMAEGVRVLMDTDYAVATTGVAGPNASDGLPSGTIWVGVCSRTGCKTKLLNLNGTRAENIEQASRLALELLRTEFGVDVPHI